MLSGSSMVVPSTKGHREMDKWLVIHTDQTYELVEKPEEMDQLTFFQGIVGG